MQYHKKMIKISEVKDPTKTLKKISQNVGRAEPADKNNISFFN